MFLIDTDPGTDDVIALLMLMAEPDFEIDAICSVYGNVDIDNTSKNLAYLMSLVPHRRPSLVRGAAKPIVGARKEAQHIHGSDGISGLRPPDFTGGSLEDFAELVRLLRDTDDEIEVLALGPLTNIAMLIVGHADIRSRIRRIVVQGGAVRVSGNTTAAATFNHYNDPVASAIVYESGIEVVQIGNDVCLSGDVPASELVGRATTPVGGLIDGLVRRHWSLGDHPEIRDDTMVQFNDALCTAYLLRPDLFTVEKVPISIDWSEGRSRGATIADFRGLDESAEATSNTYLASAVRTDGYARLALEMLTSYL